MNSVEELAARAAQTIEFHGHTKGQRVDTHGRVCLRGALYHAQTTPDVHTRPTVRSTAADYLLRRQYQEIAQVEMRILQILEGQLTHVERRFKSDEILPWNDADVRTADEVIHVLKRVANGEGVNS
jgi:hypothetical protein